MNQKILEKALKEQMKGNSYKALSLYEEAIDWGAKILQHLRTWAAYTAILATKNRITSNTKSH